MPLDNPRSGSLLYTPLETADLSGIDPPPYLRLAVSRSIATPGTFTLPSDLS